MLKFNERTSGHLTLYEGWNFNSKLANDDYSRSAI